MARFVLIVLLFGCNEGVLTRYESVTLMDGSVLPDAARDAGADSARPDSAVQDGGVDDSATSPDTTPPPRDSAPPPRDTTPPPVDSALPDDCSGGALELPIPGCRPSPVPDTGDMYADCVARINQFRAECQCLPPLQQWIAGEDCADEQADFDANGGGAHGGFRANICSPRGNAQNECPGWGSVPQIISGCLQQMWDEGPGEPFSAHGHYINMSSTRYSRVACGFYTTPSGSIWSVQNFQ